MKRKILTATFVLILLLSIILALSYFAVKQKVENPLDASSETMISFEIKQGQSVKEIGENLEEADLITGSDFLKIYLWQKGLGSKLKAGNYELSPSMTIAEMVEVFIGGEGGLKSNEVKLSVIEGASNGEILEILKKEQVIDEGASFDDFYIDVAKYDFLADKPEDTDLQGYLFPDTYNFFKDSELKDTTAKMLENFGKKFTVEMREDVENQGKSVYEILILSSIIEKEAGNKEEMPIIASVFYNRLSIGQPLQSDATVNYVTKAGRAMPTNEDLATDSPYNTYKYSGLPPTPICNPGIEAIRAAIYPDDTDYFYFLTTQDEEQTTYFSKTYEEHLRNKAMYLK